jgi:elongator complex protein 3
VERCIEATERLKDSGFKICYHIMPGLPGSDFQKDLETFKTVFGDEKFRPDMVKIYPTLVVKGSELYEDWVSGRYRPMPLDDVVELLARAKSFAPPWARIQRVDRDIPVKCIEAGVKKSNLRQLVRERMHELGLECRCIRCREAGLRGKETGKPELVVRRYRASRGEEIFLSYELEDGTLIGFVRLRIRNRAMVRELHVYGKALPIGAMGGGWQHRGYGKKLLEEAEKEAVERGYDPLYALSGVGAREYYRKLGYKRDGYHMKKVQGR